MAAHSAATTVAVAGAAASTITGTSTTTSTAISAEATFSALGGSWRWDPRCCGHGYRWRAGGVAVMPMAALSAAISAAATSALPP
jgi:hypothetical protein